MATEFCHCSGSLDDVATYFFALFSASANGSFSMYG